MTTNRCYVYAIHVNGVVRYIGKGSNGRLHFHVIEARDEINSQAPAHVAGTPHGLGSKPKGFS